MQTSTITRLRTKYDLASIRSRIATMEKPQTQKDLRYWTLEVDAAGNGQALIRFLPAPAGEAAPFCQIFTHGFEGTPKSWLIENCPTTLGLPCPVCAANSKLWAASKDPNDPLKQITRTRKRKLSYHSDILVINDPKHPENNGKVFLYRYGQKMFEKITDLLTPSFADTISVDVVDFYDGANFKLRQVKADGYPNFDKSSFDAPSRIGDDILICSNRQATVFA
jgi:hypothetical protein